MWEIFYWIEEYYASLKSKTVPELTGIRRAHGLYWNERAPKKESIKKIMEVYIRDTVDGDEFE